MAALGRVLLAQPDLVERLEKDLDADESPAFSSWLQAAEPTWGRSRSGGARVQRRLRSLFRAWSTPSIPVQHVQLDTPEDVLEVYTRSNMEGVQTSQADIFFAAVKTEWEDAERLLDAIRGEQGWIGRMDTLRFVARMGARQAEVGDPVPLTVKRLSGDRKGRLVGEMGAFASDRSRQRRVQEVLAGLTSTEALGYGWWWVDRFLKDDVLAWFCSHDRPICEQSIQDAAAYLFWGTAMRLRTVLALGYARAAFEVCAGSGSERFPYWEAVRAGTGVEERRLSAGRAEIVDLRAGSRNDQLWSRRTVVNQHGRLFLCVAQRLPLVPRPRIDWDHFYAQARRGKLKWRGKQGKARLHYHDGASAVHRAGNLVALDFSLNRSLQDKPPSEKIRAIRALARSGKLHPAELFLTDDEFKRYRAVEKVEGEPDHRAPERLADVVRKRELRLWEEALRRFPQFEGIEEALFGER